MIRAGMSPLRVGGPVGREPEPAIDFDDQAPIWPPVDEPRLPFGDDDAATLDDDLAAQRDARRGREVR
jgi:hypothetical protein